MSQADKSEIIANISRFESEVTLILVSIQKEVTKITELREKRSDLSLVLGDLLQRVVEGFSSLAENMNHGNVGIKFNNRMQDTGMQFSTNRDL